MKDRITVGDVVLTDDQATVLAALPWDDGAPRPIVEEMSTPGIGANARATRLSELQGLGLAVGRVRPDGSRRKEWARRRVPVAPRMKVERPKFKVSAVQPMLTGNKEYVILEVPKGTLAPGMMLRQA